MINLLSSILPYFYAISESLTVKAKRRGAFGEEGNKDVVNAYKI